MLCIDFVKLPPYVMCLSILLSDAIYIYANRDKVGGLGVPIYHHVKAHLENQKMKTLVK